MESPVKLFATVLAFTAFSVAIVSGLSSGVDSATTIKRAMISMIVCYGVGFVLGLIASHAINEYLRAYLIEHRPVSMDDALAEYVVDTPDEE